MSALTKLAGIAAGVSTVAVIGVAIAQGQPPNPLIPHHAIAAGQQSSHVTPMGETGVLAHMGEMRTATITREQEVVTAQPAPEPVAILPRPEPVAAAPEPAPTTIAMGAGPQPQEPAPMRVRADRN